MDFLKKFQDICNEIDRQVYSKKPTIEDKPLKLYNIFKRSLPSDINIPILWNLSKQEADYWHYKLHDKDKDGIIHAKVVNIDDYGKPTMWIYYDIVPNTKEKPNIFNNYDVNLVQESNTINNNNPKSGRYDMFNWRD